MGHVRAFVYEFFNTYTKDEQWMTILFASAFLPFQVTLFIVGLGAVGLIVFTDVKKLIRTVRGGKLLLWITIYSFVVSLLSQNPQGMLVSAVFFLFMINLLHYQKYLNRKVFEQVIDIAIILSIGAVLYSVFEQVYYMTQVDGMGFFDIQNKPIYRVKSFFYNANYYATMIVVVQSFCIYKYFKIKKLSFRFFYGGVVLANAFALYLTGARTAILVMVIMVLVMLLVNAWYKSFVAALLGIGGSVFALSLKPGLIPRLASQGLDLARREQIWEAAILMLKDSFVFGRGPYAYSHQYHQYIDKYIDVYGIERYEEYSLGIATQHAHNALLDMLISFGIVGTLLIFIYIVQQIRQLFQMIKMKVDKEAIALLVAFLVIAVTSSIIDHVFFWVNTGMIFFLLLGSCDMFIRENGYE